MRLPKHPYPGTFAMAEPGFFLSAMSSTSDGLGARDTAILLASAIQRKNPLSPSPPSEARNRCRCRDYLTLFFVAAEALATTLKGRRAKSRISHGYLSGLAWRATALPAANRTACIGALT